MEQNQNQDNTQVNVGSIIEQRNRQEPLGSEIADIKNRAKDDAFEVVSGADNTAEGLAVVTANMSNKEYRESFRDGVNDFIRDNQQGPLHDPARFEAAHKLVDDVEANIAVEREMERVSDNAFSSISGRYADMRRSGAMRTTEIDPGDAENMARADVLDLAKIKDQEKAAEAAAIVSANMESPSYAAGVSAGIQQLEKDNFADAKTVTDTLAKTRGVDAEQIPADWNKADADFEGEAQRRGLTDAQLQATISTEQQREAIPEDWNKEPRYVQDPSMTPGSITDAEAAKEDRKAADMAQISEADLAAYDALEARQAAAAEVIPEDWNKEPAAEVIPEDWNKEPIPADWNKEPAAEAIPEDWNKEPIPADWNKEPAAEAIPEDWNKEPIPADWNKEPAAEAIPEDWNKEPIPADWNKDQVSSDEVERLEAADAEHDADPFGGPAPEVIPEDWNKDQVPSDEVARLEAADAEHDADPFGAPIAEEEPVNTIEPATERTAEAEGPQAEPLIIDQQTRDNLAKMRAADRAAVEEQLGHESNKPGFVDKPLNDNQVESDEIATATKETVKPVLPPEVERQYVNVGNKYYSQKNPDAVAFEDKGNKLETRMNNEQVATNLVKIAEARGWDEIKVSGSETFRREVWVEAAARGMQVKGYTPNDQDKATLAKRMVDMEANKVEAATARDQKPGQTRTPEQQKQEALQTARAESFKNDSRETALKKHPELAGAYAAQAAMQKKMEADRLPADKQAVVQARVRENLANSIERGQIPEVKRREEVTNKREVSEERGMDR